MKKRLPCNVRGLSQTLKRALMTLVSVGVPVVESECKRGCGDYSNTYYCGLTSCILPLTCYSEFLEKCDIGALCLSNTDPTGQSSHVNTCGECVQSTPTNWSADELMQMNRSKGCFDCDGVPNGTSVWSSYFDECGTVCKDPYTKDDDGAFGLGQLVDHWTEPCRKKVSQLDNNKIQKFSNLVYSYKERPFLIVPEQGFENLLYTKLIRMGRLVGWTKDQTYDLFNVVNGIRLPDLDSLFFPNANQSSYYFRLKGETEGLSPSIGLVKFWAFLKEGHPGFFQDCSPVVSSCYILTEQNMDGGRRGSYAKFYREIALSKRLLDPLETLDDLSFMDIQTLLSIFFHEMVHLITDAGHPHDPGTIEYYTQRLNSTFDRLPQGLKNDVYSEIRNYREQTNNKIVLPILYGVQYETFAFYRESIPIQGLINFINEYSTLSYPMTVLTEWVKRDQSDTVLADMARQNEFPINFPKSTSVNGETRLTTMIDGGATSEDSPIRLWLSFFGSLQHDVMEYFKGTQLQVALTKSIYVSGQDSVTELYMGEQPKIGHDPLRLFTEGHLVVKLAESHVYKELCRVRDFFPVLKANSFEINFLTNIDVFRQIGYEKNTLSWTQNGVDYCLPIEGRFVTNELNCQHPWWVRIHGSEGVFGDINYIDMASVTVKNTMLMSQDIDKAKSNTDCQRSSVLSYCSPKNIPTRIRTVTVIDYGEGWSSSGQTFNITGGRVCYGRNVSERNSSKIEDVEATHIPLLLLYGMIGVSIGVLCLLVRSSRCHTKRVDEPADDQAVTPNLSVAEGGVVESGSVDEAPGQDVVEDGDESFNASPNDPEAPTISQNSITVDI